MDFVSQRLLFLVPLLPLLLGLGLEQCSQGGLASIGRRWSILTTTHGIFEKHVYPKPLSIVLQFASAGMQPGDASYLWEEACADRQPLHKAVTCFRM